LIIDKELEVGSQLIIDKELEVGSQLIIDKELEVGLYPDILLIMSFIYYIIK
jgi:hypothetical protein